jgi:hypothetical protein
MASIINASTSGAGGVITTADASGVLELQSGGTTVATIRASGVNAGIQVAANAAPAFSAYQSTDQTGLSSNTYTKCNFQTEEFDTNSNFASSTFTPTVAGYYQLNWGADLYAAGGGTGFIAALYKNGSLYKASSGLFSGSATEIQSVGSAIVYMNGSTDYVDVYVRIVGGSARQTYSAMPYTFFNGSMIRSA